MSYNIASSEGGGGSSSEIDIFSGSELRVCYIRAAAMKRVPWQRGMLISKTGAITAGVRQPPPHV